jgi:hypothetical protein
VEEIDAGLAHGVTRGAGAALGRRWSRKRRAQMFASVVDHGSLPGDGGFHWDPWPIYPVLTPIIKPSALPRPHRRRSFSAVSAEPRSR